jgi:hypothetical protein
MVCLDQPHYRAVSNKEFSITRCSMEEAFSNLELLFLVLCPPELIVVSE